MDLTAFPRQLARTRRFTLGVPRAFTLSPGGERVLFLRTRGGEDPVSCLWLLAGGRERLLADPAAGAGEEELPQAERVRRERARERATGIVAYTADDDLATAAYALDGALWTVRTDGGSPRRVPTAGPVAAPRIDPTGRRVAYVADGALRVVELADGTDRLLAAPDGSDVYWGLPEHVAAEGFRPDGHWWAPDGRRLLATRVDESRVQRWWISDPADPARPPRAVRYPAAGTANADVSLHVFDAVAGDGRGEVAEVRWDRAAFEYLTAVAWDAHGPLLSVQSRDQRTVRVLAADPATGATRLLHEERDPAWVRLVPGTPLRTAGGALVRVADRDDTWRLVVGAGGEAATTPAGLQVGEVLGAVGETVYFTAAEEPTEQHVWSFTAGRGTVRHSGADGPGLHTGAVARGALLLESRTDGGRRVTLTRTHQDTAAAAPAAGAARAAAGTQAPAVAVAVHEAESLVTPRPTWLRAGPRAIRTALLLPTGHTPGSRRLPVLMNPYSGPAMQLVVRAPGTWPYREAQWFADCGFAVVVADGRGTPGRGPGWEKEVHGDTLGPVVEDQVEALHAAARHCTDLDLDRVAIRGWSYGGTLATAAVLRRPDVFHAAVAGAAPSDQRLYETHWRERFLGHPDEHPERYERSSPLGDAPALRRPLLLVHGLADDNVVVAHTLRMSAALLAAGRPHQVLPLSGAAHSPNDETVVARLLTAQLAFLREALAAPRPA